MKMSIIKWQQDFVKRAKKGRPRAGKTRGVGRPQSIDDASLLGTRDFLVRLLENTWGEVGWNLKNIKDSTDVPRSLRAWQSERDLRPVVRALLREVEEPKHLLTLGELRRQLFRVKKSCIDAAKREAALREFLVQADQALLMGSSENTMHFISRLRAERAASLADAQDNWQELSARRKDFADAVENAEARFAQAELLKFCKSRRNRLNPLRIANALAGLPFLGCRQSIKRCSNWKESSRDGQAYQIFKTIYTLVDSWEPGTDLTSHVRRRLQARRRSISPAISELQANWYYLRQSVESAKEKTYTRKELPFKVTDEYSRRMMSRSPVDVLLEEGERIIPVLS